MKRIFNLILLMQLYSHSRAESVSEGAKQISETYKEVAAEPWTLLDASVRKAGTDTKLVAACFEAAVTAWPEEVVRLINLAAKAYPMLSPLMTATVTGIRPDLRKEVTAAAIEGLEKADSALTTVTNPITKKPENIAAKIKRAIIIAGIAGEKYGPVDSWLWKSEKEDLLFAELSHQILTPAARISNDSGEASPPA